MSSCMLFWVPWTLKTEKVFLPINGAYAIFNKFWLFPQPNNHIVWHSSITQFEERKIERIQKTALKIILASEYETYEQALLITGLLTLKERRKVLCKKFAKNCIKNEKMSHIFPKHFSIVNTRKQERFYVQPASTERLARSAIPYMQRLLNENWTFCTN